MSDGRPDHVLCAINEGALGRRTYCQREPVDDERVFEVGGDVIGSPAPGQRDLLCPGCAEAIVLVVELLTWDGTLDPADPDEDEDDE